MHKIKKDNASQSRALLQFTVVFLHI